MSTKLTRPVIVVLLLLGLSALPLAASAQGSLTFFLSHMDASKFPEVHFDVRALDLDNQVVTNLNSTNLSVYENGQLVPNVQVAPRSDGPLNIIFVVDQGDLANFRSFGLGDIRDVFTTLVKGGYFVDGRDTVLVLGRQNINSDQTVTLLPTTNKGADLTIWAANFNFEALDNPTKGLLAVDDAIAAMSKQVPVPGSQAAVIIFLTRYIQDPSPSIAVSAAPSLAQKAQKQYISIYTFQTDLGQARVEALQILATGSHGQYVALNRGTVATVLSNVYQAISGQRTVYTVTYRSQLGTSGARQITLNSPQPPPAGVAGSYEVTVQPPTVKITGPAPDSTIRREPKLAADGHTWVYDKNSLSITAEVDWPTTAAPRNIKSAELWVNGVKEDTAQPAPGETQVQLKWDISDLTKEGIHPSKVEVRVTDELGLGANGTATINIDVAPKGGGGIWETVLRWVVFPLVCLALLAAIVVIVSLIIFFVTRPGQTPTPRAVFDAVQNTVIIRSAAKHKGPAMLKVLEGPKGLIGETFNLSKATTVIGRNPKSADIVFYPNEESSVSRVHCTIQIDGKYFVLTDNNSANGTRINDELLKPNDPVQLRDGDEIVLGDLAKMGVKLKFNVQAGAAEPRGSSSIDRTFIIDEYEKDDLEKYKDG